MERTKFIASCSFGKDSLATLLLTLEHNEPLDEAVYCEVMFNKDISGEVPEHRDFIYKTAIPALERMGIKIIVASNLLSISYAVCISIADVPSSKINSGFLRIKALATAIRCFCPPERLSPFSPT